ALPICGGSRPPRPQRPHLDATKRMDHAEVHLGHPDRPLAALHDHPAEDASAHGARRPALYRAVHDGGPASLRRAATGPSDLARACDAEPGAAALPRPRLDPHEAEHRERSEEHTSEL